LRSPATGPALPVLALPWLVAAARAAFGIG